MPNQGDGEYRLSGNLGLSMIGVPVVAAAIISVLAVIYAYITVYSPIAGWISILFVAAFAFGVGASLSFAAHLSKCRNMSYAKMMGAIAAVFAIYTSWVAFEYVLLSRYSTDFDSSLVDIFMHPQVVWEIAQAIAVDGWYGIGSMQIAGMVLWVFWALEAAIVFTVTWLLAPSSLESSVFCENCGEWADEYEGCTRFELSDDTDDISRYHPQNLTLPLDIPPFAMLEKSGIRIDTWSCAKCSDLAAAQTHVVQYSIDKDGDLTEVDEPLSPIWLVPFGVVEALHAHRDVAFAAMEAEDEAAQLAQKMANRGLENEDVLLDDAVDDFGDDDD